MEIRKITDKKEKQTIARQILEALPEWFGIPEAREEYIAASADEIMLVSAENGAANGFLCLKRTGEATVELAVMGVLKECHRRGIGTALFDAAKRIAAELGFSFIQVKTVRMGLYPEYDATNRFYQSLGFREFEVFPTLWDERNPCQIYVMALTGGACRDHGESERSRPQAAVKTVDMPKELRGKRVILREQRIEDAEFFAYWFNQPDIMFRCGFEAPTDEDEERRIITENHRSEDSVWFTVTDQGGNIIGEAGLLRMFPAWRQTDLTIIIPDPEMRHKGFGTETIRLILDLAFKKYGMHRVSIGVVGQNAEALAFYKKIGFKQEGILEDGYYYNNEYSDFIMMRLLSNEWVRE